MSEMMMDVFGVTKALPNLLTKDWSACTLRFKSSASTDSEDYEEVQPRVYAFTYDDFSSEVPAPSILIQPTQITGGVSHYVIYVNVVHPAVQEREIVDENPSGSGQFVYRDGTDFTDSGVRPELYRASLMLAEVVFESLLRLSSSETRLKNLSINPPSPYMSEFPYCSCTVELDFSYDIYPKKMSSTRLQELL